MSGDSYQGSRRWVPFSLIGLCTLFVWICIPVMDGPNSRLAAREAASVGTLRSIVKLQSSYAVTHPTTGFACELPSLASEAVKVDYFAQDEFLMSGERVGYKFAIADCRTSLSGVVIHYQVTAVPREPGKSGIRAFCTDEFGQLWYDSDGSSVNCLVSRRQL